MTFRYSSGSFFAAVALVCSTSVFAQQNRGTAEQQAACAPDAFRLCSNYIPDPTDVASCLRERRSELSGACGAVFDQADRATETRVRSRRARDY